MVARGATEGGGIPPSAVALRGFRGRLLIGRQPVDHQWRAGVAQLEGEIEGPGPSWGWNGFNFSFFLLYQRGNLGTRGFLRAKFRPEGDFKGETGSTCSSLVFVFPSKVRFQGRNLGPRAFSRVKPSTFGLGPSQVYPAKGILEGEIQIRGRFQGWNGFRLVLLLFSFSRVKCDFKG